MSTRAASVLADERARLLRVRVRRDERHERECHEEEHRPTRETAPTRPTRPKHRPTAWARASAVS